MNNVFFLGVLGGVNLSICVLLPMLPPSRQRAWTFLGATLCGLASVFVALWIVP